MWRGRVRTMGASWGRIRVLAMVESDRPSSRTSRTPRSSSPKAFWPAVIRAGGLGFRPERLVIMVAATLIVCGLTHVPIPWEKWASVAELMRGEGMVSEMREELGAPAGLARFAAGMTEFIRSHFWSFFAVGLPAAAVMALAWAAVARMAAMEQADGRVLTARRGVAFAFSRSGALASAFVLIPLLVVVGLGVFALLSAGLFRVPVLNIAGALVYGAFVVVSILFTALLLAFAVGAPMIPAAVVCEGMGSGEHGRGDGIDAIQRTLAYVTNAPVRLGLYGGVAVIQTAAVAWIGAWLASGAVAMARAAAEFLLPAATAAALRSPQAAEGTDRVAARVMGVGDGIPWVVAIAAALSVAAASAMMVYLLLRRVCDGQHEHDIWMPAADADPAQAGASEHAGGDDE